MLGARVRLTRKVASGRMGPPYAVTREEEEVDARAGR